MKEKILEYLRQDYLNHDDENPPEYWTIADFLNKTDIPFCSNETGDRNSMRWWDEVEMIYCLNKEENIYLKFWWAKANRDEHVRDLGWTFNEDTAQLVKKVTVMKPVDEYILIEE